MLPSWHAGHRSGRSIRSADMAMFNMDNLTTAVFADLATVGVHAEEELCAFRSVAEARSRRRPVVTSADLEEVARIYREHLTASPTRAVRRAPQRLSAVVPLVAGLGLRQGEVFGLEVDGLDFLRGRAVDVHQQLVTLPGQPLYLGPSKSDESHHVVPLTQVTLDAGHLRAPMARRRQPYPGGCLARSFVIL